MEIANYLIIIVLIVVAIILIVLFATGFLGKGFSAAMELFKFAPSSGVLPT